MATVDVTPRKVRLANTHNVLTRTRPLNGTATVGEVAIMNASGEWEIADGSGVAMGIFLGFTDGRIEGLEGDDAEVILWGIVAGFDVEPGVVIYDGGDGTVEDSGTQALGIGLNDGLLYVRPDLA
jgi:hypothetical protein